MGLARERVWGEKRKDIWTSAKVLSWGIEENEELMEERLFSQIFMQKENKFFLFKQQLLWLFLWQQRLYPYWYRKKAGCANKKEVRINPNFSFKKLEGKGKRWNDSFQRAEGQKRCFLFCFVFYFIFFPKSMLLYVLPFLSWPSPPLVHGLFCQSSFKFIAWEISRFDFFFFLCL